MFHRDENGYNVRMYSYYAIIAIAGVRKRKLTRGLKLGMSEIAFGRDRGSRGRPRSGERLLRQELATYPSY